MPGGTGGGPRREEHARWRGRGPAPGRTSPVVQEGARAGKDIPGGAGGGPYPRLKYTFSLVDIHMVLC